MGLDNPIHLAILLMILLLVFGAKRLPEMGRSLGSGLRGFKESINGESPTALTTTGTGTGTATAPAAVAVEATHDETVA
jgi:sec-independent protein translocase protein TatA